MRCIGGTANFIRYALRAFASNARVLAAHQVIPLPLRIALSWRRAVFALLARRADPDAFERIGITGRVHAEPQGIILPTSIRVTSLPAVVEAAFVPRGAVDDALARFAM